MKILIDVASVKIGEHEFIFRGYSGSATTLGCVDGNCYYCGLDLYDDLNKPCKEQKCQPKLGNQLSAK